MPRKHGIRDLLVEDDPVKCEQLAKELGYKIEFVSHNKKFTHKFKDEVIEKNIRIPRSPFPEDWSKSESQIEKEHEYYFRCKGILYFNTKVKGEVQATGGNNFVLKKSQNKGFFDMSLVIKGKFCGLELKHGGGGIWSAAQIAVAKRVREQGAGLTFVSNSVRLTDEFLRKENLIE